MLLFFRAKFVKSRHVRIVRPEWTKGLVAPETTCYSRRKSLRLRGGGKDTRPAISRQPTAIFGGVRVPRNHVAAAHARDPSACSNAAPGHIDRRRERVPNASSSPRSCASSRTGAVRAHRREQRPAPGRGAADVRRIRGRVRRRAAAASAVARISGVSKPPHCRPDRSLIAHYQPFAGARPGRHADGLRGRARRRASRMSGGSRRSRTAGAVGFRSVSRGVVSPPHRAPRRASISPRAIRRTMNLLAEGTPPERIHRVGNTGIDSLRALLATASDRRLADAPRRQVLVTLHRRENWDSKADVVCDALIALCASRSRSCAYWSPCIPIRGSRRASASAWRAAQFTLVRAARAIASSSAAAANAALVISDSGGIQEEVPHLGVPLLVPRSCTERPEGVATGFVRIVGRRARAPSSAKRSRCSPCRAARRFRSTSTRRSATAWPPARIVDVLEASLMDARSHDMSFGPSVRSPRRARRQRRRAPTARSRTGCSPSAQVATGPHAGAIAGCITASGSPSYVYPEIAGYYLQWLAWRATAIRHSADRRATPRGPALACALARDGRARPTRVHFDGRPSDWRNHARVLLRPRDGPARLGRGGARRPAGTDAAVVDGIRALLERLIASRRAVRRLRPARGHRRRFPTAGRRGAARSSPRPRPASCAPPRAVAHPARRRARRRARRSPQASACSRASRIAKRIRCCTRSKACSTCRSIRASTTRCRRSPRSSTCCSRTQARWPHSGDAGSARRSGPARVDVIAQTLRIGYLLLRTGRSSRPIASALARLRQVAGAPSAARRGVAFARAPRPRRANVWATMFADQALAFAAPARDPTRGGDSDPLIV